jgi:hypothetical protein
MEDDEFEKYSMREMPETKIASFEEHLLICEHCRTRLEESEAYVLAMCRAGTRIRSSSQTGSVWSWAYATAAAAIMVLAAISLIRDPQNIKLQETRLYAMRGAAVGAKVSAGRPLLLIPDLTGLPAFPSYRLQLVDASGTTVSSGEVKAPDPAIRVEGVRSGIYFVRLSSPAGELLREYGLESDR